MEHATPPRFGTQPIYNDDLFAAPPPARRAVTAVVQCRVCGEMVKVPLLSDVKVCATCIASWPTQRQRLGDAVIEAERAYDGTVAQMEAAAAAASVEDVERYSEALAAQAHPRFAEAWRRAIKRNDGLTPLLIAHDARALAEAALDKARSALRTAEREMERILKNDVEGGTQ
jgi:hypothetical protein